MDEKNEGIRIEGMSDREIDETINYIHKFVKSYTKKDSNISDEEWLKEQFKREFSDKTEDEVGKMAVSITSSVKQYQDNLADINDKYSQGISKEKWLADKLSNAAIGVSIQEFGNYLRAVDTTISNANAQMYRTITTNAGNINQCINLDGFIAEQKAVNTFNLHAAIEGSPFYAEVQRPGPGQTYGLNSFDLVIKDSKTGQIVHQYQAKFGKDAEATIRLLKNGNYNNQRFLVPKEQLEAVKKVFPGKSVSSYIGGTDKVKVISDSFSKNDVKQMQSSAQLEQVLPQENWNVFKTDELVRNIGKKAGVAGIQAAAITVGFDLVQKKIQNKEMDSDEAVELALKTGSDAGIKVAASGALKVVSEKGLIALIPPGTPPEIIANMVCVGIEDAKILAKVADGELSLTEALDQIGRTTTAMVYGLSWGASGALLGALALSWVPIVGPVIGGIVGGAVGYMAGSKYGNAIYTGAKKVTHAAKTVAKKAWNGMKSVGSKILGKLHI